MLFRDSFNIANGASLSDAVDLNDVDPEIVGIIMPDTWTAAGLTFQVSVDGTTFKDLYDSAGNEVTIVAVQDHYIILNPQLFTGLSWLKVRSGTAGTPVNQAAARVVTIVTK